MPGPSVVFNSLSSLYFEVESGELGLPHEEGAASLPLCIQKMNRRKIFFRDDSASFVLEERKTTHV
jgi:hypothetical protein